MSLPMALPLRRTPSAVRGLCLLAFPHGGQRSARRNAWAGMSAQTAHGRARAEAEEALGTSVARARPVRHGTGW